MYSIIKKIFLFLIFTQFHNCEIYPFNRQIKLKKHFDLQEESINSLLRFGNMYISMTNITGLPEGNITLGFH